MEIIDILSIASGLLQMLGYGLYIKKSLSKEIDPNPFTWFMFAYGTTLLTVLEFDRGASPFILILPVTCSTCGVYVAYLCWRRGKMSWPEDGFTRAAIVADLSLTVLYLISVLAKASGNLTDEGKSLATLIFLFGSNATTLTSFFPMLKETYKAPWLENWAPWTVWALAYSVLTVTTFIEIGREQVGLEMLIYPISCAILHGLVGLFSIRKLKNKKMKGEKRKNP